MTQNQAISYRDLFRAIIKHRSKLVLPVEQDAFIEHVERHFEKETGFSISDATIEKRGLRKI